MITIIETILLLLALGSLAFNEVSRYIWTPAAAVILFLFTSISHLSWLILLPVWLIYFAIALLFNISKVRFRFLSQPVLTFVGKSMPPMSETERVALDAGNVWWDAELFRGKPNWQQLHAFAKPTLTPEEQRFLDKQVETFCSMIDDWQMMQTGDMPQRAWDYLKQEKFFGMVIPKEYGGLGFSALAHSTVVTKVATRSASAAVTVMVPNSLGPAELLMLYGTDEQKKHYLPRLASGKEIPCFGLTAAQAGSDAAAMPDRGIICKGKHKGKEVIGIKLNFDKRYITLAPVATVLGVAFKLYDPDKLFADKVDIGITLALIPANHPGVETGERHNPLNLAFMNGPMRGNDVFIPLDWIIGGEKMAGEGWRMLMECLSIGRLISLPALSTATAKLCYRTTGAYAALRQQFRMPIGHLEGVEECLARIGGYTYLLEATRVMTANAVNPQMKPTVVSAIAKYNMTEISRKVYQDAMDIHAGKAIQLGPRNYLGGHYFSLPISITVEGANLLTRNLIIFGQGAIRCHPYVRAEMQLAQVADKDGTIKEFDKLLCAHIGYASRNIVRTIFYGFTAGKLMAAPIRGETAVYYRQLTRMSAALATVADIAMMILGGELKRKERLSARLADVLSQLYLASSVLKYHFDQKLPSEDLPCVHWSLQQCLHQIQVAFDDFFINFPQRWLGRVLRFIIFPYGRSYREPIDKISHQVASQMLVPSALRNQITEYCYIGKAPQDAVAELDCAFDKLQAAQGLEQKLRQAMRDGQIAKTMNFDERMAAAMRAKVLTQAEVKQLQELEQLRNNIIAVDEFPVSNQAAEKKSA